MKKATKNTTTKTTATPVAASDWMGVDTTSSKRVAETLWNALKAAGIEARQQKSGGTVTTVVKPADHDKAREVKATTFGTAKKTQDTPVGEIVVVNGKGADPKAEPGVKGSPKEPKPAAKVATLKAPKAPKTPKTPKEPKTKAPKELILKVLAKGVLYFPKVATDKLAGLPYVAIEVKGNKLTVTPTKSAKDTLEVRHNQVGIAKLLKETAWTKTSQDLPVKMVGDSMQIEVR